MNGEVIDGEEPAMNGTAEFFSGLGKEIKTAFNERARLVKLEIDTAREIATLIRSGLNRLSEDHAMDVGYIVDVLSTGKQGSVPGVKVGPAVIEVRNSQNHILMSIDINAASDDGLTFDLWYREEQKAPCEKSCNVNELYDVLPAALATIIPTQEMSNALAARISCASGDKPKP